MTAILSELGAFEVPGGPADGLWLEADQAAQVSGWALRPEGLCRGDICVPVPAERAADFVTDGKVNLAEFWDHMGMPSAMSAAGDVWALGEAAENRGASLLALEAPDFALPDAAGTVHRLSDYRGKKILLATWASW